LTDKQKVKHACAVLKELEDRVVGCEVSLKNLQDLRHLLEKPHTTDKKTTGSVSLGALELCSKLWELIQERKRNFRRPDMVQWGHDMDKIIRIDKRTPQELGEIIEWCQQDDFWQNNILSPSKLRKQLDRLELQMQRDHKWKRNRSVASTVDGKTAKTRYLESLDDKDK